jgi:hypothetical protein
MNRKQNPKFQMNNPQDASRETMNNEESTFGILEVGIWDF